MASIILTSDDFGMSAIYNAEIINASRRGLLSSVSVMVNRGALQDKQVRALLQIYEQKKLSIGLHLEIEGRNIQDQCIAQWESFFDIFCMNPDYVDIHKDELFKADLDTIATFCKGQNTRFRKYPETTVNVNSPDVTLFASYMDLKDIVRQLIRVKQNERCEIVFHIGAFDELVSSTLNKERENDLVKLASVRQQMQSHNISLINYNML